MSLAAMQVPTVFTAKDRFSSVINGMTKNTRTFGAGLDRMNKRINDKFSSMNNLSQLAVAGGIGTLFYKAGQDVIDYEAAVASLGAVTGTVVGSMSKDIESLGRETGRSVIDITKGFENIGSKMSEYLTNPTALKEISKQSILMADAARMTVEDSTDNLTSIMNQFKLSYTDAFRVVNKLSAGEDVGASTISESSDLVRQFASSARMAGADLETTIALVQSTTKTLGKDGVGRGFRNLMVDLNTGKGMDKNKLKALSMVGADVNKIINPATEFIDKLKEIKKLLGNKQAMGMFFKKTGFETGATFLNSFDLFEKYLKHIKENNTAQEKANKNNATFAKGWLDLKNAFTNYIVTQSEANTGLNVMKGLLGWMKDHIGVIINLIAGLVGVFVAWKAIMFATAAVNLALNIAMGISAFNAGAMAIAMEGNAVAIGVYEIATVIATGTTATLGVTMWAVLAPILAVIAVLGVLGFAMYKANDAGKAMDSLTMKRLENLDKQNGAWKKSTNVMSEELNKQRDLMRGPAKISKIESASHKTNIDLKNLYDDPNTFKQPSIHIPEMKGGFKMPQALNKNTNSSLNALSLASRNNNNFEAIRNRGMLDMSDKNNLAGSNVGKESIGTNNVLKVVVDAKNGSQAEIDDSQMKGISVRTTSTKKTDTGRFYLPQGY